MAKALPIKTKRQSTAAYAASQPLFDVLRNGMERLKDQRASLQLARDAVQSLHVKLPTSSIADDVRHSHEKYMDGAVKAWRLATESYTEIFMALADVTAADPSAGREKREGHEAFLNMALSARQAHETAMDWKFTTPSNSVESETQSGQGVSEDEDMKDVSEVQNGNATSNDGKDGSTLMRAENAGAKEGEAASPDTRPTNSILMSLLNKQNHTNMEPKQSEGSKGNAMLADYHMQDMLKEQQEMKRKLMERQHDDEIKSRMAGDDAKSKEDAAEKQTFEKTVSDLHDLGRTQKRLEKRRKRKEKRSVKKSQDAEAASKQAADATEDTAMEPKQTKPQYEDVSAEVAARLKAKEFRKEPTKEKKRKRESAASLENGEANAKPEKPSKKRVKSNQGEAVEDTVKAEKLRKHEREGEGGEAEAPSEGRKKRKKA